MKIGIDARMMGKKQATGIGNYIQQLIVRLVQNDSENEFYIFLKPENFDLVNFNNPRVHKVLSSCHWYSLCEQIKFYRQLKKLNLDLVHFPQFNVPILYRRPFIVTIHDVTPLIFPGPKRSSWLRDFAFNAVFKHALKKSQKIIAVSEYSKSQILNYFKIPAEKIIVTYLGIESEFKIAKNYAKIEEVKGRYNLTKPYLFFVGAWRPHKNIVGLIEAFDHLKNDGKFDGQLLLGGQEDPRYKNIRQTIDSMNEKNRQDVITPGFIGEADLPFLYQGACAYIIPSFLEGFGLNGLEAMASETPVICSKTGSLPEVYGEAAIYFNPASPEEMAEKIYQTLSNPELLETLRQSGKNLLAKYDWDNTAKQTLQIYQDLLRK